MALKVPIRFRGDRSKVGLEAERVFDAVNWFLLYGRTSNAFKIVVAKALDNYELSVLEWMIITRIGTNESGDYTITKLADEFDLNVPQSTVLVKGLIARNLVRQKVSAKDRRIKFLSCTRRGAKLVYESDQAVQHAMRYWLFDLSDTEIIKYVETMKKICEFEIPQSFS